MLLLTLVICLICTCLGEQDFLQSSKQEDDDKAVLELLFSREERNAAKKQKAEEEIVKEFLKRSDEEKKREATDSDEALLQLLSKKEQLRKDQLDTENGILLAALMQNLDEKPDKRESGEAFLELLASNEEEEERKKKDEIEERLFRLLEESDEDYRRNVFVKGDDECQDLPKYKSQCPTWKSLCTHDYFSKIVHERCPLTCGICKKCKNDVLPKKRCELIVSRFRDRCLTDQRVKDNCHRSCGYCKAPSPPACENSAEGCCWDLSHKQNGSCPDCLDLYKKSICINFKKNCNEKFSSAGNFVRQYCPETCDLCPAKSTKIMEPTICKDNWAELLCMRWKQRGICSNDKIARNCQKSCDKCQQNTL